MTAWMERRVVVQCDPEDSNDRLVIEFDPDSDEAPIDVRHADSRVTSMSWGDLAELGIKIGQFVQSAPWIDHNKPDFAEPDAHD